jgi:hypothetical protein
MLAVLGIVGLSDLGVMVGHLEAISGDLLGELGALLGYILDILAILGHLGAILYRLNHHGATLGPSCGDLGYIIVQEEACTCPRQARHGFLHPKYRKMSTPASRTSQCLTGLGPMIYRPIGIPVGQAGVSWGDLGPYRSTSGHVEGIWGLS